MFGDIGTSPLYALKESFVGHHPLTTDALHIFGVISIIFWTMLLIVTVKYIAIMMRADNKGEGGSLSLLALISRAAGPGRWSVGLTMLGVFATALFFGDAMITPAISVLSAVEGLQVINPAFARFVLPISVVILVALFAVQSRGTEKVGLVFGPIVLVYFAVLVLLGVRSIVQNPEIFQALLPTWGFRFFAAEPGLAFLALGSIVLAVTGAETLYADMGHFGRRPIRIGWLFIVFPALMTNYMGQGALLLRSGNAAAQNPFYLLAPEEWRLALVALATMATIIASQAVITGAFSVTRQAVQLGLLPRLRVLHTSYKAQGQIYLPLVNWSLLFAVVLLIFMFGSSTNLASAYGIAVTGTMFITTIMLAVLAIRVWKWPPLVVAVVVGVFAIIDGAYFASNLTKIADGGWFPLLIGVLAFTLLTTWARGRALIHQRLGENSLPVDVFAKSVVASVHRIPGTAVYLTASSTGVPSSLLHNLKHNQVLHEQVLLLTVEVQDVPAVPEEKRGQIEEIGCGISRVILRYGFTEDPDIPAALAAMKDIRVPEGATGEAQLIQAIAYLAAGKLGAINPLETMPYSRPADLSPAGLAADALLRRLHEGVRALAAEVLARPADRGSIEANFTPVLQIRLRRLAMPGHEGANRQPVPLYRTNRRRDRRSSFVRSAGRVGYRAAAPVNGQVETADLPREPKGLLKLKLIQAVEELLPRWPKGAHPGVLEAVRAGDVGGVRRAASCRAHEDRRRAGQQT